MKFQRDLGTALLLIGVGAASAAFGAGCSDDVEPPQQEATIEAAGEIEPPVENCELDDIVTDDPDAGSSEDDTGASNDAGVDGGEVDAAPAPDDGSGTFSADIERVGDAVAIPYLIRDREGDDQRIRVEICTADDGEVDECGTAVRASGDDGTFFVPTTPAGACVLHVFYWDVGCGRFVTDDETPERRLIEDVDQPLVARVSVVDSDDDPVETRSFALSDDDLDFDTAPACE
ncbi:MAG: hypothetical protein ACOCV2_05310 [Persicimonas sp.]